jgi:membrane fusion protein (multidrug efflux system)
VNWGFDVVRKTSIKAGLIPAAAVTLLLPILSACGVGEAGVTSSTEARPAITVPVVTEQPVRGEAYAYHAGTVNLEADAEASVVAKVGGEIREILVEEGERVTAGQVLARLDRDRLRLQAQQALAELNRLKQEYRRNVQLHERGLVSEGAFENLRYDLEALDAAYRLAKLELDYADIRAPIDGVVSERTAFVGNNVIEGQSVFRVSNSATLLAYLHVPQRDLFRFSVGQRAELSLDAYPGEAYSASVLRISPRVDSESGTVRVTLAVDGRTGGLRPGMFARARIVYEIREDTLLVPAAAVLAEDAQASVFVVEDGIAKRRAITTGLESGERIEVTSGLEGSEQVIVVGQSALRDGTPVTGEGGGHSI